MNGLEHGVALGDHVREDGRRRREVHGDEPPAGGASIRLEISSGALARDPAPPRFEVVEELEEGSVPGKVLHPDAVLPARAARDREHEPAPVVGDAHLMEEVRILRRVEEDVGRLRHAQPVEEDFLVLHDRVQLPAGNGRVVARVIEALAIRREGRRGEFDPLQDIARAPPGLDVEDAPLPPVRAPRRDRVREILSVMRDGRPGEGHGAVLRKVVRVEQHARRGALAVEDVQDGLVLEAVFAGIEKASAFPHRGREALVVPEPREPVPDRGALGDGVQKGARHRVFCVDPRACRRRIRVLERAEGIADLGPVVVVHL